jgi:hypothetical protein
VSPIAVAFVVFACVLGGALLGMVARNLLPESHMSSESKDVVRLGIGMIATMTALILGLMIASAKSSFDAKDDAVKHAAVVVLSLDRMLADYGPETKDVREILRQALAARVKTTWPAEASADVSDELPKGTPAAEGIVRRIAELSPKNSEQQWFQSRALDLSSDVLETRWTVFAETASAVSTPFFVIVTFWLTVIFISFGLYAPRNTTVIAVLMVCALSVAASVFLIMELDKPFDGILQVSSAPLRSALAHLGQ